MDVCILGFSFGGMLAWSVTASLWKSPLINTNVLEKNLCCIALSPPLINTPLLQEVCVDMPQIKSTLHSIIIQDDVVPRLTMFLDPKNEDVCVEFPEGYHSLPSVKVMLPFFSFRLKILCSGISRYFFFQFDTPSWSGTRGRKIKGIASYCLLGHKYCFLSRVHMRSKG